MDIWTEGCGPMVKNLTSKDSNEIIVKLFVLCTIFYFIVTHINVISITDDHNYYIEGCYTMVMVSGTSA